MTQQQTPRPIDEFAAAIYASVRLDENFLPEALVLKYRDKLTELAAIRERHDQFIAVSGGRSPTSTREPLPVDGELTAQFREACALLSGEQLSVLDQPELYRRIDHQFLRLCQCLAKAFFLHLEKELEAGHVGQFQSFKTNMGRCTLPVKARGRQFESPLDAMMNGLDADKEQGTDRRSMASVIEFLIDQDVPLAGDRRLLRRFRPLQLIVEQATPPIRQFLRFVSGTRLRQSDDLAHGRFTAIVFFHYVVDSWDDEALQSPARAPARTRRSMSLISGLRGSIGSIVLAVCILATAIWLRHIEGQHRQQITELQRRIAKLETAPVPAPVPQFALSDHEQEFTELLTKQSPSVDLFANRQLTKRFEDTGRLLSKARPAPTEPDIEWPQETSRDYAGRRVTPPGETEDRISLVERRTLAIHSRLDTLASREELEKLRSECLSKQKSVPSVPATDPAAPNPDTRRQLSAFTQQAASADPNAEVDSNTLARAILAALRNKLEMPPIVETRITYMRNSQSDINSKETFAAIEKEAKRICEDLDVNVPAVFNAVVVRERQQHKGLKK